MHRSALTIALSVAIMTAAGAADAMPMVASPTVSTTNPALIQVADHCGPGRYRGVGGYCQGRGIPTIRKVCTVRRYAGALVRRCHTVRL